MQACEFCENRLVLYCPVCEDEPVEEVPQIWCTCRDLEYCIC